jgi:hypothetical protein
LLFIQSFFFASRVATERSRRGEFAKFMAHHVFGDENFDVPPAVVNHECVSDELRDHGAGSGPSLNRLFFAGVVQFDDFGK